METQIVSIDQESIVRICSGQVIVHVSSAIKELIENSLDAHATSIEIKIKEYGYESIEVRDNGDGISEENYALVTKRYCTSKIRNFNDLLNVASYGFRGEALNSLCNIANVSIVARTKNQQQATRITYAHDGSIVKTEIVSAPVGTAVLIDKLFVNLPVRRKELSRTMRKEYQNAVRLIQEYGMICANVRFNVFHQDNKGYGRCRDAKIVDNLVCRNRSNVMSTKGNGDFFDSLSSVLGKRVILNLVDVCLKEEDIQIEGYISRGDADSLRKDNSHQFVFVNNRPVDVIQVNRCINELFRTLNASITKHQYPSFVLNFTIPGDRIDVNVSPDKRQIIFRDMDKIMGMLQTYLNDLLCQNKNHYDISNEKKSISEDVVLLRRPNVPMASRPKRHMEPMATIEEETRDYLNKRIKVSESQVKVVDEAIEQHIPKPVDEIYKSLRQSGDVDLLKPRNSSLDGSLKTREVHLVDLDVILKNSFNDKGKDVVDVSLPIAYNDTNESWTEADSCDGKSKSRPKRQGLLSMNVSMADVINQSRQKYHRGESVSMQYSSFKRKGFSSQKSKEEIEQQLSKEVSKEDFKKMTVVGQFNKGFIITKLRDDLFILDQHASDEKFNYEYLMHNTKLNSQKLLMPMPLELNAIDELIVLNHLETFRANGFDFDYDPNRPPLERLYLSAYPFSKNTQLGIEDVHELINSLRHYNDPKKVPNIRLSRLKRMFASRACRKSIMIGQPLDTRQQKKIVEQMGTMKHPWNCPHGRPTMRHLCNLTPK